jgi:hypothetical protein
MTPRLSKKRSYVKVAAVALGTVLAIWFLVHLVFLTSNISLYELVPLATSPAQYSNVVARFTDPTALNNVRIPVRIDKKEGAFDPEELWQIRRLVAAKFWLRPRKIEGIELSSSNEVFAVVRPLFGASSSTLFVKKESSGWIILTGEAKL